MKYDIIIIGAGPAGLNCAYHLQKSNKKILILEKNKIIGPKICGGGLTPNCYNYLKPPKKLISKEFTKIKVHSNLQKRILDYKTSLVRTCNRKTLAKHLLKKLKNIDIKTNTKLTKITKDYIVANNQKIKYNILIGADGSNSIVRRYLNLKPSFTTTFQYKIKDNFKDFEMYFNPSLIGPGYFWIIPHKDFISVGCGTTKKYSKNLLKNFHKWLKKQKIDISKSKLEAFPINCNYQNHEFDNIFLIGDAAGFASELTGEGIYQALTSGEDVAKKILNPNYKYKYIPQIIKTKNRHKKVVKLLNSSKLIASFNFEMFLLSLRNQKFINKLIKSL